MSDRPPHSLPTFVQEAFIAGTLAALQELYQLEGVVLPDINVAQAIQSDAGTLVVASIQLQREPAGTLTIAAPLDVARSLAERYLPAGSQISDELLDDCLGELANVIAGQGKTALKGTPYHFMLTTPVATRHSGMPVFSEHAWRCAVASEAGTLALVVELSRWTG